MEVRRNQLSPAVCDIWLNLTDEFLQTQIMDPKMDSGYLGPEEKGLGLEDYYDVLRELTPEEVVWIMDELLCHEVGGKCSTTRLYLELEPR